MVTKLEPDYEFDAYVKSEKHAPVLCNVALWLPNNAADNVQIEIDTPYADSVEMCMGSFISIESEVYQSEPSFKAIISKAWIKQFKTTLNRRGLARARLKLLTAWDLTISEKCGNRAEASELADIVNFQISNLNYAEPNATRYMHYLGERKAEIEKTYEAISPQGFSFKIEKHYSECAQVSKNKEVIHSQNVIAVSGGTKKINIAMLYELDNLVKDFSLLLTFAARHPTIVLGYEYFTGNKRVRYFDNPMHRKLFEQEEQEENELIVESHFESYANEALKKWDEMNEEMRVVIRGAIISIHPLNGDSADFLNMFSALESLIKVLSSNEEINCEINQNWTSGVDIRSQIAELIDGLNLSEGAKGHMKRNLKTLKFGEMFAKKVQNVLTDLSIYTHDLCDVIGENSLYTIRNKLTHEGPRDLESIIVIAQESLQTLLERIILVLLGFGYIHSSVSVFQRSMRKKNIIEEIKDFQSKLKLELEK